MLVFLWYDVTQPVYIRNYSKFTYCFTINQLKNCRAKICERLGMQKVAEIPYCTYLDQNLEPIFKPPWPHESVKIYCDCSPQYHELKKKIGEKSKFFKLKFGKPKNMEKPKETHVWQYGCFINVVMFNILYILVNLKSPFLITKKRTFTGTNIKARFYGIKT